MRSRRLKTLEGLDTRPTGEKAREALFSILQSSVPGARVLDLYAGSGALSLEALSRGADFAVMVDCAPKACKVISENINSLGCKERTRLLRCTDLAAIGQLKKENEAFDLIFMDPPYRMDASPVCQAILEAGLLKDEGMIIVEHAKETPPHAPAFLILTDRRNYGAAGISFYRKGEEGQ